MSRWVTGATGADTELREATGLLADVVADDNTAPIRAANTTALNDACAAALAAGHSRVILPPGTIHYGTTATDSGIVIPPGVTAVELVGSMLGPHNDGHVGSTLSYWGTGAAITLDEDDGGAIDAATYGGVEGFTLTHVALIYGGTATTALDNGKGNYGTGTYGIRDWRGGRIYLDRAYIAGFEWGVWGIQSDENTTLEGKFKRCHVAYYIGPRSDQFYMASTEFYFCDLAIDIDGAHQTRIYGSQFVDCGTTTTPSIKVRSSQSTRTVIGTIIDSCWFEYLHGGATLCPSFIDVAVGDTSSARDVHVVQPYINTNTLASGEPHVASFMRIGNAIRTRVADPSMLTNTSMEQLVEFVGALPASPDLTIEAHDQQQYNTLTSGSNTPVVCWDLRTATGGKGIGGPLQLFSQSAQKRRWHIQLANTETGSGNTGSDLQFAAYDDAGAFLANFITIARGSGAINLANAVNVVTGTGTGTKFGTATTQKLAFYGKTPIVQPSQVASPTADVTSLKQSVDAIRTLLVNLGLMA